MVDDMYLRVEEDIVSAFNAGEITDAEFRAEMRALHDEIRFEAEMAAQEAYDEVMIRY